MQFIYFTIVAIVLYIGADWILNRLEQARGERFEYRQIIFFIIILTLALTTFTAINYLSSDNTGSADKAEELPFTQH